MHLLAWGHIKIYTEDLSIVNGALLLYEYTSEGSATFVGDPILYAPIALLAADMFAVPLATATCLRQWPQPPPPIDIGGGASAVPSTYLTGTCGNSSLPTVLPLTQFRQLQKLDHTPLPYMCKDRQHSFCCRGFKPPYFFQVFSLLQSWMVHQVC